jgi:hypothetical protein
MDMWKPHLITACYIHGMLLMLLMPWGGQVTQACNAFAGTATCSVLTCQGSAEAGLTACKPMSASLARNRPWPLVSNTFSCQGTCQMRLAIGEQHVLFVLNISVVYQCPGSQ